MVDKKKLKGFLLFMAIGINTILIFNLLNSFRLLSLLVTKKKFIFSISSFKPNNKE